MFLFSFSHYMASMMPCVLAWNLANIQNINLMHPTWYFFQYVMFLQSWQYTLLIILIIELKEQQRNGENIIFPYLKLTMKQLQWNECLEVLKIGRQIRSKMSIFTENKTKFHKIYFFMQYFLFSCINDCLSYKHSIDCCYERQILSDYVCH